MEDKKIFKTFVDTDTGELMEIYEGDKLRIIRKEQEEAIKKSLHTKELNKELEEWNNELGGFVFILFKYGDILLKEYPDISPEDISKLFYLATYVDYEGFLVYDNSYLTRKEMNELLKIHINNFDVFFNKMKKLNIFILDKNRVKINKEFFYKGEIDKEIKEYYDYTRMYLNSIRYLFENVSQRKHKQLGNYFKLIPYIHRQINVLCWNPDSNPEDIKLMRAKELQDILGIHRNTIRNFINEMVSVKLNNGESIIAFIKNDPNDKNLPIIINPKVCYGGNFDLEKGKQDILKWF